MPCNCLKKSLLVWWKLQEEPGASSTDIVLSDRRGGVGARRDSSGLSGLLRFSAYVG